MPELSKDIEETLNKYGWLGTYYGQPINLQTPPETLLEVIDFLMDENKELKKNFRIYRAEKVEETVKAKPRNFIEAFVWRVMGD